MFAEKAEPVGFRVLGSWRANLEESASPFQGFSRISGSFPWVPLRSTPGYLAPPRWGSWKGLTKLTWNSFAHVVTQTLDFGLQNLPILDNKRTLCNLCVLCGE